MVDELQTRHTWHAAAPFGVSGQFQMWHAAASCCRRIGNDVLGSINGSLSACQALCLAIPQC
eukprot:6656018-Prymnesium_polylepis.1